MAIKKVVKSSSSKKTVSKKKSPASTRSKKTPKGPLLPHTRIQTAYGFMRSQERHAQK